MMQTPDEMQREADLFARCLLMPEEWVRDEARKIKGFSLLEQDHVKRLAKTFAVSPEIMAFRLGEIYWRKQ